jgi:hypothetical protein
MLFHKVTKEYFLSNLTLADRAFYLGIAYRGSRAYRVAIHLDFYTSELENL